MSARLLGSRARERGHHDAVFQGGGSDLPRSKQNGDASSVIGAVPPVWAGLVSELRTAVDVDGRAGDPASVVGCEEGDDRSDIGRFGDACNACIPRMKLWPASVLAKSDNSVSVTPGATALTRMPRGPGAAAKSTSSSKGLSD